jgi:hypothetical protein
VAPPHAGAPRRFDLAGAALATLALGGVTFGFVELQSPGANRAICAAAVAAGFLALAAFARVQATSPAPMIPRELFGNRTFVAANAYTLLLYAALGGALYFIPFALQFALGYSPVASGLALLPFVVVYSAGSGFAGKLFEGSRTRAALIAGPVFQAAGFVILGFAAAKAAYWQVILPGAILLGVGAAIFVAPLTTLAMNSAGKHAGAGSGVNNAVARAAGLLAIAMIGAAVYVTFQSAVDARVAQPGWSPAARAAVHDRFDRIAALQTPAGIPRAERPAFQAMLAAGYLQAFRVAMLIGAALSLSAAVYASFAIRSGAAAGAARPAIAR